MHRKFVDLLCCPETREPLQLFGNESDSNGMVQTGYLKSASGAKYPIVRGVPRFVSREQYAGSFGFEWNRWPRVQFESENVGRRMAGHTTRMWETITAATDEQVRGQTIVEFGCGPGRFLDVVRNKGGIAIGMDLSHAVEAARKNFADDPDVLILQADILNPPLCERSVDAAYSIGVLHHTPDPVRATAAMSKSVRDGGWVACCVYPKNQFYDYRSVAKYRRCHNWLKPMFGYRPALAYSMFAGYVLAPAFKLLRKLPGARFCIDYLERNWVVTLQIKDARWRVLDVFDAITPEIATTHTADDVRDWLNAAGCEQLCPTPWGEASFVAVKKQKEAVQAA